MAAPCLAARLATICEGQRWDGRCWQYDVLRAHERGEAVIGLVKLVHGDSFGEAALLARQRRRCVTSATFVPVAALLSRAEPRSMDRCD